MPRGFDNYRKTKDSGANRGCFYGRICLLTICRFLGFALIRSVFIFATPKAPNSPYSILAEINNTPWNERYCYVLDTRHSPSQEGKWTFEFDKTFHVSPFMPMQLLYIWKFSMRGSHLIIHMQLIQANEPCFDATLQMESRDMTPRSMLTMPLSYPFLTCWVVLSDLLAGLAPVAERHTFSRSPQSHNSGEPTHECEF